MILGNGELTSSKGICTIVVLHLDASSLSAISFMGAHYPPRKYSVLPIPGRLLALILFIMESTPFVL